MGLRTFFNAYAKLAIARIPRVFLSEGEYKCACRHCYLVVIAQQGPCATINKPLNMDFCWDGVDITCPDVFDLL